RYSFLVAHFRSRSCRYCRWLHKALSPRRTKRASRDECCTAPESLPQPSSSSRSVAIQAAEKIPRDIPSHRVRVRVNIVGSLVAGCNLELLVDVHRQDMRGIHTAPLIEYGSTCWCSVY